ncbi:unnamed protein product [Miscanthus lutarioriparius]|uniref:Transducin/WD40 repeat-like superfamily protein n=1 Tax=Miscanthus lutarioriparius TaxID=422564 RepID=A0A811NGB7_9POAL|nr:unnamed protein product [Miscanthus lutarioriparius]
MPPKELPGFYYDPEKNRYFPIRGRIPGAAVRRPPPPAPAVPPPPADTTGCSRKRARRPELLSAREMYGGGVIFSNNAARSTFKQQYHYAQASQPTVWKYQATTSVADKALEQLDAMVQTPQGLKESRMLVTGSMNGSIRLYGLGIPLNNSENEAEFLPQPAWTPAGKHKAGALPSIWSSEVGYTTFSSSSDIGAGLLDLETRRLSWLCRSKSDVLSLKFVHSGKVVLCGLRNGSIAPVDVRQKQHNQPTGVASSSNARRTVPMLPTRHAGKKRNQAGMDKFSRVISMSSAVCSLVTLSSDENYFLGSSMDGSIKLFDLRLIQKGGIQSYEGHVNSHTHLPIVVDPSETLLMSGGEDCTVRIWSIKTGELLFAQSMADRFTAFCWPESSHDLCSSSLFDLNHSWGAWLGSRAGLFYMHGT